MEEKSPLPPKPGSVKRESQLFRDQSGGNEERPRGENCFHSCIPQRILTFYYLAINPSLAEMASGKKDIVTWQTKTLSERRNK